MLSPFVALIVLATRAIAFALVQRAMRLRKAFPIRKSVPSVDGVRTLLELTFVRLRSKLTNCFSQSSRDWNSAV